jgi:hypothetical protein
LRHATDRINLSSGMAQPEGGLTTHSTRAEIARMSFVRLDASLNSSRRVNSGVRHAWMLRHEASRREAARARAATRRRSNKRLHPTGICLSLIEKMSHDVVVSRRVNRGVRSLLKGIQTRYIMLAATFC